MAARLQRRAHQGDAIAVMGEGIGNAVDVATRLQQLARVRVHPTILGHAQRAARPTSTDRAMALDAGHAAASLLLERRSGLIALHANGPSLTRRLTKEPPLFGTTGSTP